MEPGTIKRLLNHYFSNPKFCNEISRALKEFFGDDAPKIEDGQIQFRSEEENSLFNEWFVYDFRLSNGKTPLEDFYYRNPYHLKIDRLQIYKDLQENVYSYFKVIKKILGSGLVLEDIITGRIYEVKEYSLTFEVFEGQSFPTRVGRVGDHYEIVGGNIYVNANETQHKDYETGLKKINKIFKFMLEKRISNPELYRLYAKKAICYLALENFEKGKFFLQIAIQFNPYYRFAQRQLEKVKALGFDWEVYVDGHIEKDPAYQYYLFIMPFKINFAHEVDEVIV